jgi:uncharacterized protein with PIN domain
VYEVERQFKETHQDYKTDDDEIFIPYRSFKENVTEALKEALNAQQECPPCDTIVSPVERRYQDACSQIRNNIDHLTDE